MERFAIKIDNRIKLNLYSICRLCGTDNPNKIQILEDDILIVDDELSLCRKISECVGVQVSQNDKMPQSVCSLCADKINDFFEYKEMCKATNIQTRNLLGLPPEQSKVVLTIKKETVKNPAIKRKRKKAKIEPKVEEIDAKPVKSTRTYLTQRGKNKNKKKKIKVEDDVFIYRETNKREKERERVRKRPPTSRTRQKRKEEIPEENINVPESVPLKKAKVEPCVVSIVCIVCSKAFSLPTDYNAHIFRYHTPNVLDYGCVPCREAFFDIEELKDHQTWHKISNTAYNCFKCNQSFERLSGFSRHLTNSCLPTNHFNLVDNIFCDLCNVEFLTKNLFDWHDCFIKPNTKCRKCNRHFYKPSLLFKHFISCDGELSLNLATKKGRKIQKENLMITQRTDKSIIKSEPGSIIEIENEQQISEPGISHMPEEQYSNEFDEQYSNDNNELEQSIENELFPVVRIKREPIEFNEFQPPMVTLPLTVRIKQEILSEEYGDVDVNILRNIKKEPTTSKPTLKIKIKKEHGTLNSTFVDTDMEHANSSSIEPTQKKQKNKNKIYKIPKQLAIFIKQEKMDRDEQNNDDLHEFQMPVISEVSCGNHELIPTYDNSDLLSNDLSFSVYESSNLFDNNNTNESDVPLPIITDVTTVPRIQIPLITNVTTLSTAKTENYNDMPTEHSGVRVKMEFDFSKSPYPDECYNSNEIEHSQDLEDACNDNIVENTTNEDDLNTDEKTVADIEHDNTDLISRSHEEINELMVPLEEHNNMNMETNKNQSEIQKIELKLNNDIINASVETENETIESILVEAEKEISQIENSCHEENEKRDSNINLNCLNSKINHTEKDLDKDDKSNSSKALSQLELDTTKTMVVNNNLKENEILLTSSKEQTPLLKNSLIEEGEEVKKKEKNKAEENDEEQQNEKENVEENDEEQQNEKDNVEENDEKEQINIKEKKQVQNVDDLNIDEDKSNPTENQNFSKLTTSANENEIQLTCENNIKESSIIQVQENVELKDKDDSIQSNNERETLDNCSLHYNNEKQSAIEKLDDENDIDLINSLQNSQVMKETVSNTLIINLIESNKNDSDISSEEYKMDDKVIEHNIKTLINAEEQNEIYPNDILISNEEENIIKGTSNLPTEIIEPTTITVIKEELLLKNDIVNNENCSQDDILTNMKTLQCNASKLESINSVNLEDKTVSEECLEDILNLEKSELNNSENEIDSDLEKELLEEFDAAKKNDA